MGNQVRPIYRCTQLELYSTLKTIWDNYDDHQVDLLTYKSKYDAALSTTSKGAITAAKNLPDEEARNAESQNLRIEVVALANTCTRNWQLLKSYIQEAYPGDNMQVQLDAAGMNYYINATKNNWEFVDGLNTSANNFITANSADLLANGFMPAGFKVQYKTASDAFDLKYDAFKHAQQSTEDTDEKIVANNAIYTDGMKMCGDATMFFVSNDAIVKKFTFTTVLQIVSPPGSASLKLQTIDLGTNVIIVGAKVIAQKEGNAALNGITNDSGEVLFPDIDPGAYTVTIDAVGYKQIIFNKDVNTGVGARKDVFMTATVL